MRVELHGRDWGTEGLIHGGREGLIGHTVIIQYIDDRGVLSESNSRTVESDLNSELFGFLSQFIIN